MSLPRAFTALSGASAISMVVQVVRGKLAALLLGPAGVGIFNQLSLMWNLFQIAGSLGSFNGVIQNATESLARADNVALRRLVSTWSLLLGGFSCVLAALGVLASSDLSNFLLNDGGKHSDLVSLALLSVPFGVTSQIYRALLSASRAVRHLVRAQILSDVGGGILFVILIFPLGLHGAILGFMATQFLFFLVVIRSVRSVLGPGYVLPRLSAFSGTIVRANLGYGASGLILIALSNLSIIMVSRMIIEQLGIDSSGIFANSWRIASVYLGAVTAAALSYYLPTLTRCNTAEEMGREVNTALRFYLYTLPLVMAAIMAGGPVLVWLILSSKFLGVAPLLLIFVPAELIRIMAESISMPLLAKKRVLPFTILYIVQASGFVIGAALLLPSYGLIGATMAYALSLLLAAVATYIICRGALGIRLEAATRSTLWRAFALLGLISATCFLLPFGLARLTICAVWCAAWIAVTLGDPAAQNIVRKFAPRWGR